MIYLFRIFENGRGDYLEFESRDALIQAYQQQRDPLKFDWSTVSIKAALKEEGRLSKLYALKAMQNIGDTRVLRVVVQGGLEWYSPSNAQGIPSEYSVAVKCLTASCVHYQLTDSHHEVFKIAQQPRFKALSEQAIQGILQRVQQTRCAEKLDRYLDMNLRKLRHYGVQSLDLSGSYVAMKEVLSQQAVSCPFFSRFMLELLELCVQKEMELLGEPRQYRKAI
jgi:hypothetical protein